MSATMLANRLRKRQRHLRKWASRNNISCYRLYERDIPEFPLIVDWYDGEVVVWLYERKGDEDNGKWQTDALNQIQEGLNLTPSQTFVKTRARQRGLQQQYQKYGQQKHIRLVQEQGHTFEVNLSDYLDTGLFLDHRSTRAMVQAEAMGQRVLNLFAYTGSFSCYAAVGGAKSTTTVDLSKKYCAWAVRNLQHNDIRVGKQHRVLAQDCWQFLAQEKRSYDLIICDPPTFSNSKRMARASFSVDRDYPELLQACLNLLARNGSLIFSTNSRGFRLKTAVSTGSTQAVSTSDLGRRSGQAVLPHNVIANEISQQTIPQDFRNKRIHRCWRIQQS